MKKILLSLPFKIIAGVLLFVSIIAFVFGTRLFIEIAMTGYYEYNSLPEFYDSQYDHYVEDNCRMFSLHVTDDFIYNNGDSLGEIISTLDDPTYYDAITDIGFNLSVGGSEIYSHISENKGSLSYTYETAYSPPLTSSVDEDDSALIESYETTSSDRVVLTMTFNINTETKTKYISNYFGIFSSTVNPDIVIPLLISIFILGVFLFLLLAYGAGRRYESAELHQNILDKTPTEFHLLLSLFLIWYSLYAFFQGYYYYAFAFPSIALTSSSLAAAFLPIPLLSLVTKLKAKTFIKSSIIYLTTSFIFTNLRRAYKNSSVLIKVILYFILLFFITVFTAGFSGLSALFFFAFGAFCLLCLFAVWIGALKSGAKRIENGDLDTKINTDYMFFDFKQFGDSLNQIDRGLEIAMSDKLKSERLKTTLITNVSHDIKTPLTSIINYVDLIKKEDIENEKVQEYLEVLDRQSQKLKNLILDLVDASKISTGNIEVSLEQIEINTLLQQIDGEYTERFSEKGLTLIIEHPTRRYLATADGRYIYRVFDNLLTNMINYSLEGTRAYIKVELLNNEVAITFKNTSKDQLNITADELKERFVRGDSSRNTEGNGLGLSIAESLCTAQDGKLDLSIDADLFTAIVSFKGYFESTDGTIEQ